MRRLGGSDRMDDNVGQNQEETLSLVQVAQRFGVSDKTIRRWIKAGKLEATQVTGPYGPEYRIPIQAVQTAQHVMDVVPVERGMDPRTLGMVIAQAVREGIAQETQVLTAELAQLRQQVDTLTTALQDQRQEQARQSELRDHWVVETMRGLLAEHAHSTPNSWWARLFRGKN